tara:strand:+ start:1688 stop:3067 length:1380 start_codon:yes stop_codon:yes gene_type:complete
MSLDDLFNQVDNLKQEIVQLEQDLIKIPSVNTGFMPTGNETEVCHFIQKWLNQFNIQSEILSLDPNRGNLIATLPGKSNVLGLLFMSHLDVVPVEDENKWDFSPFGGEIYNDRIYGRGATDCKGLLTCQLMALRILKQNNIALNNGLSLISGADEEHGGRYGFEWLAKTHPEKLDAPYAINEGGGTPIDSAGALNYMLGVGEKGRLQVEFTIKGSSAHASVPWQGNNALYSLAQLLSNIEKYDAERDTSTSLFEHLSSFAIEHKPDQSNIDEIIEEQSKENPRFSSILKALSRMTITPTMVNGGIKSNSVPETISLTCDVRTLPHQSDSYLSEEIENIIENIPNISYEIDYMAVPNSSNFDTNLTNAISKATKNALKRDDINVIPYISTGFTDSRFTRELGVTTYGYSGSDPSDDPMLGNAHGTNESIGINSLISGTKIMLQVAIELLCDQNQLNTTSR